MTSKNDITGDKLQTKAASQEYRNNYDLIFGKSFAYMTPEQAHMLSYWIEDKGMDYILLSLDGESYREEIKDPFLSALIKEYSKSRHAVLDYIDSIADQYDAASEE